MKKGTRVTTINRKTHRGVKVNEEMGTVIGTYTLLGRSGLVVVWDDDKAPEWEKGRHCHPAAVRAID